MPQMRAALGKGVPGLLGSEGNGNLLTPDLRQELHPRGRIGSIGQVSQGKPPRPGATGQRHQAGSYSSVLVFCVAPVFYISGYWCSSLCSGCLVFLSPPNQLSTFNLDLAHPLGW